MQVTDEPVFLSEDYDVTFKGYGYEHKEDPLKDMERYVVMKFDEIEPRHEMFFQILLCYWLYSAN